MMIMGLMIGLSSPVYAHTQKKTKNYKITKIHKSKIKNTGTASWYGKGFSGRKTASGEKFNPNALTAAHRSLPLGTKIIVTNTENGKSTVLKITDRGPYTGHRILDVSKEGARRLGMIKSGTARIKFDVVGDNLPTEYAKAKE